MRGSVLSYVLIVTLVLLIFGVISFGDVLSVLFYIFIGALLLVLIGVLVFRYKLRSLRRRMENDGNIGNTNGYGSGRRRETNKTSEGEVRVEWTQPEKDKKVNNKVGDYVDYEDIKE